MQVNFSWMLSGKCCNLDNIFRDLQINDFDLYYGLRAGRVKLAEPKSLLSIKPPH
jgi:hypothetical protein